MDLQMKSKIVLVLQEILNNKTYFRAITQLDKKVHKKHRVV